MDLLLCFTFSSSVVERVIKEIPLQERMQRAHMLSTTMENLLLVSQAPPVTAFAKQAGDQVQPVGPYLPQIIRLYMAKYGAKKPTMAPGTKPRRDSGLRKDRAVLQAQRLARGAPQTEAVPCF